MHGRSTGQFRLPVRTQRLVLRPPRSSDGPELIRALRDPTISRGTLSIPYPYRPSDWAEFLARARRNRRAGVGQNFTIVDRASGTAIGMVGLHQIDRRNSRAVLGYWLAKQYRRRGLAVEAVSAVCRLAFRELRLHRLKAEVFTFNWRSAKLLLGLGFRLEGRSRHVVRKRGRWTDEWIFGLLRPEFHAFHEPRPPMVR